MVLPLAYGSTTAGGGVGGGFFVPASSTVPFADNAARDVWAAANLSDLINGQTVVFVSGTPNTAYIWRGTTEPASYSSGDWEAGTPLFQGDAGTDGADGVSFAEFESIPARDASFGTAEGRAQLRTGLPIIVNIGNDVVVFQVWRGPDTPASYNAAFWQDAGLATTPGTVRLGNIEISSGGNSLFVRNIGTGRTYVAQGTQIDLTTGSVTQNNVPVYGAEAANAPQPLQDVTITTPTSNFTITATIDQILSRYSLWFAADTANVSIRVYDGPNNTDPILIDVVRDMTTGENEITFPSNPRFEIGNEYLTEYSTTSPQLNLMGSNVGPGSTFFPRFQSYGLPYSEVSAITSANVGTALTQLPALVDAGAGTPGLPAVSGALLTNLNIPSQQPPVAVLADLTITDANKATYENRLLYTPASVAGNLTINISQDMDFSGFDLLLLANHAVLVNGLGTVRISGEQDIRFTQYGGGRIVQTADSNNVYGLIFDNTDVNMLDNFVDGASLSNNILTLTRNGSLSDITVDLSSLAGGTDTNDHVNTVSFASNTNVLTLGRTGALPDLTVDLSALAADTNTYVDTVSLAGTVLTLGRSGTLSDLTVDLATALADTNDHVDSATFNSGTNTLTLGRTGTLPDLNVDLSSLDRDDENIQDLIGQMVTGNTETGITVTYNDTTGKLNFVVGTPAGTAETFYHGLSNANNADTILTSSLTATQVGTGTGQQYTFSVGPATANDYVILLVPADHDLSSLINTDTGFSVLASFTRTANHRTIGADQYHSYVLGPLVATFSANYRATLA